MNQTLTCTADRPACTCRLGAGILPKEVASETIHAGHAAPLSITNAKGITAWYWLVPILDDGKLLGYRLVKDQEDGEAYDVPADLSSCSCPDFLYHRGRKAGPCKHTKALRSLRKRNLIP